MTILSARSISKAYGPQTLLLDASLTITEGDRVGLLGTNGSGKSTLLRILAGLEPADGGVIDRRRGARVEYLPQEPELRTDATPRAIVEEGLSEWHQAKARHDAVTHEIDAGSTDLAKLELQASLSERIETLGGWQRDHVAAEMLQRLGVTDVDRPVGTMSGGEKRRVALARLLVSAPDLAILDEPTNHLDTATIEWLEGYLAEMPGAVLLVTHDRYVLDAVATRVFELDGAVLREFRGNYTSYLEQKETLLAHEARAESNRLNLVRRERAWLMRGARARTTKQKARIQRAEEVIAIEGPREAQRVKLEASATRTGNTILELRHASLDLGGRRLISDLTLHMVSGDRIGVVGPNGIGKTSLLKLVSGELEAADGEVVRGTQTKLAYFDQARAGLIDAWSIFDNVAEREGSERTGAGMVKMGDRVVEMRTYLEGFLFDAGKQRQKVSSLSGGERARVALAKMLKTGANLLLLDEPTNDLDVATLSALEEMLEGWPGCALVVTHDRYFLNRVANSLLAFEGNGSVVRYPGDYEDYRARREENERQARSRSAPPPPPLPTARTSAPPPRAKPLSYAERLELETILELIAAAEEIVRSLQARLADPALYAKAGADAGRLQEELARAEAKVSSLTARWESLEARKDAKR